MLRGVAERRCPLPKKVWGEGNTAHMAVMKARWAAQVGAQVGAQGNTRTHACKHEACNTHKHTTTTQRTQLLMQRSVGSMQKYALQTYAEGKDDNDP